VAAPAILKIDIVADATKALKALQDTGGAAEKAGGGFASAGKAIAGVVSAGAVVAFGTSSVKAAEESAVATARLEQIFSSMGDTTGQAAAAAGDYATQLSKKIGVDDEAIMAGQAQLATFGEVSSETARMAGIFDRATAAGADLAAAGFGSIESNAVQLGKALQDPTKGMTALAKSGVTFTDSQKAQIAALQESGDLLGAQKIVLAAVEQQVGGTAAATATSSDKMKVAFGEVQEQIGGKLMPVVAGLMDLFTRYSSVLVPVAAVIAGLIAVTYAWGIAQQALAVAQGVATAATWLFNVAVAANPIGLIVIAIAAFIAALVVLFTKVDFFRNLLQSVWDWIAGNWPLLLAILLGPFGPLLVLVVRNFGAIKDAIENALDWIRDNWPLLLAILTGPVGIAVLAIIKNFDTIRDVAAAMVGWVSDRFQDLLGFVSRVASTFSAIMAGIADAIRLPMDAATAMYNWVADKVNALLGVVSGIRDRVTGAMSGVADALRGPLNAVIRAWNSVEFTVPSVDVGPVHFGGQTIGVPDVPYLARGGTVLRTGLALVHEGETFSGVGRSGSSGATVINVNVTHTGLGADSPKLQRDVVAAIRGYVGRNGPLGAPIVAPS
jgi:phage-related protein